MNKRVLLIAAAVMTSLLALAALWQFRSVVIYVLISLALAATVRPIASIKNESSRKPVTRLLLIVLYLIGFGIFGLLLFFVGRLLVGELQRLAETISTQSTWMLPAWLEGGFLRQAMDRWLPAPDKLFAAITGQRQLMMSAVLGFTQGIGGFVSGFLVILFLSVYWSINQYHFERLWLSLLSSEQRKPAREIWRTLEHDLGAYIRSEIIQSLLAILLLGVGYWLLGAPYPVLMALVGAFALLVPVAGAALAVILPLLLGLLPGAHLGLLTILYTLIVLIALQVWVEPRLFIRRWHNPILTLVMVLALADVFGLPGIIVAPPLSVVCQILWSLLVSDRLAPAASGRVSDLNERHAKLRIAINEMDGRPPKLVVSSLERLTVLLAKAEPVLQAALPPAPVDMFHPSQPVNGTEQLSVTTTPESNAAVDEIR